MSNPPISYSGPVISPEVPWETRRHIQLLYQKLANHTQAFGLIQTAVQNVTNSTTTIIQGSSTASGGTTNAAAALAAQVQTAVAVAIAQQGAPTGIAVNDQTGQTAYTTVAGDNSTLIAFSNAAAIAVTLTSETPPWACFMANIGAGGTGTVTVTPAAGTISYAGTAGGASMAIAPGASALVAFDGTNWWGMLIPASGGGGGVTQIVAGTNVTISPVGGTGVVTVNSTGSGLPVNNPTFTGAITGPHYESNGSTPGLAITAAAGTGASSSIYTPSNDTAGIFTVTTGTGTASGVIANITFVNPFVAAVPIVILTPGNGGAASASGYFVPAASSTGFSLSFVGAPPASTAMNFYYFVMG